jgi:anaphase-promoting complex subunit 1
MASAQQSTVQALAIRALSMPIGKGILTFSSRTPLPTEKFHVPGFSFLFRLKPQNTIIAVEKQFLTDTMTQWPLFHLGVAGALSISPESKEIDTSWIIFNKPSEPTSRHAGFLLGLGLNGHLKKLARWHLLNYLTPKHVMTSIALLLGLGISHLGSKDGKITKLLSVHVAAMLPPGAADLNIDVWIQTAGILALGFLYYGSRHRRTCQVLHSELSITGKSMAFSYSSSKPAELNRDEGYRISCGFALGLINIGKGPQLKSVDERAMIDRLCRITEGTRISENAAENMIVAIPGCIVALALMYLRTNDEGMARKLDVPQTAQLMEYVRPDLLFLRIVAKNLVLWDQIQPSLAWFHRQFPPHFQKGQSIVQGNDSDGLDVMCILVGACYVLGLRFAGTHNKKAKDIVLHHFDMLMKACTPRGHPYNVYLTVAMTFDDNVYRINCRFLQDALSISLACIMAGSGDLDVLRRLRRLHGRRPDEANYGNHMAAHMSIGLLFMSGGQYTIGNSPLATAALFISTYPKFPCSASDNTFHLQAFRHLWILAAEKRCLIPRSVETFQPVLVPIKLVLKSNVTIEVTAPCLLPDFNTIRSIETSGSEFQQISLDFVSRSSLLNRFRENPMIFVARNSIVTAFRTSFEQGLARVVKTDETNGRKKRSIAGAVQEYFQTSYIEDEHGTSEGRL